MIIRATRTSATAFAASCLVAMAAGWPARSIASTREIPPDGSAVAGADAPGCKGLDARACVEQAIEAMGLKTTQMIATVFDGITRHSPEGLNFKHRAEQVGWKEAVRNRDQGTWDWTENRSINPRR